jgi:hypothetical protein
MSVLGIILLHRIKNTDLCACYSFILTIFGGQFEKVI